MMKNKVKLKTAKVLGDDYKLNISYKNVKLPKLNVENSIIDITLPNKYKKLDNNEIVLMLIEKMYDSIAITEIERSMEKTRKMLGFAPEDFIIKRMKNFYGKCNDKIITINPDIIMYDRETIDYVVLHQFCHLKYKTHSKGFNDLMEKYMPTYKKINKTIAA